MAVELDQFRFTSVQIDKSQSLGVGSYGAVYIARCDQLRCAAKLLHPVLIDSRAQRNLQRFEQECQFLSDIRHPNIIQYLGTLKDPKSGYTVLLMELMDENLTNFLERSPGPLPYHLEVNFCHDIALAIAFLHANGIIHRDLSSNNVLLIAGSRAKVTDFGTSMLLDTAHQLTQCPGTSVYMPPEALNEPPVYMYKLDCFSLGVLSIQIMTRLFPNPEPASKLVEDPRYPMGKIQVLVPETERRQPHTNLIDPDHPLLPLAIQCLGYKEQDRPSAQQLCNQLATIKEAPKYVQSMKQTKERERGGQHNHYVQELQKQVVDTKQANQQLLKEKNQLKKELEQAAQKNWEIKEELTTIIRDKEGHAQDKELLIKQNQQLVRDKQQLSQVKEQMMRALEKTRQEKQQERDGMCKERNKNIPIDAESQQAFRRGTKTTKSLRAFSDKKQRRDKSCKMTQDVSSSTDSLAEQQSFRRGAWSTQSLRISMPTEQPRFCSLQQPLPFETSDKTFAKIVWSEGSKIPRTTFSYRGSATVDGNTAYFRCVKDIYAYNSLRRKWSILPQCPHSECALAMVKGLLTAIGGDLSSRPTNTLFSLSEEGNVTKWSELFPPMPTKRYHTMAVCSGRWLIVAGGRNEKTAVTTVEVMDTDTHQWYTACSLPQPIYQAAMTFCGENLYMLGGYSQSPTKSVLTCSLSALLKSTTSGDYYTSCTETPNVWKNLPDVPLYFSTCTPLRNELLAIGGEDAQHNHTTAVHKYDPTKNAWVVVSHMTTPRSQTLVAVLPGDRLVVVGGWTFMDNTKGSEIATVL